jgi:hypothetical protein
MIQNVLVLNSYVTQTGVIFSVEREMGYAFEYIAFSDTAAISWTLQWLGFIIVVFSLLWANKDRLKASIRPLQW